MLSEEIFSINSELRLETVSLKVFQYQYKENKVYRRFCDLLGTRPEDVNSIEKIPFLPIRFFKSHQVISGAARSDIIFTSSGTTGSKISRHLVSDLKLYEKSFFTAFENLYGKAEDLVILALLPSYLEREGSSLIYMVNALIDKSEQAESGFYLHNLEDLQEKLRELDKQGKKILLIGVSFALLELVEKFHFQLKNTIIMETGGMKGRRKEIIRKELHEVLKEGFGVAEIHSEYGMTELLSQAYATGDGLFKCPPWMKMLIRDPEDALSYVDSGKSGGINVIDLANLNSCAFIATQDLGKQITDSGTEILGRFDNSDIRGCNLLIL